LVYLLENSGCMFLLSRFYNQIKLCWLEIFRARRIKKMLPAKSFSLELWKHVAFVNISASLSHDILREDVENSFLLLSFELIVPHQTNCILHPTQSRFVFDAVSGFITPRPYRRRPLTDPITLTFKRLESAWVRQLRVRVDEAGQ